MTEPEELLAEAEEQIEAWLCELDGIWSRILDEARAEATETVARAHANAAAIVRKAEEDATALLSGSARLASMQLAESEAEVLRARALAIESNATARALAIAADAAVTGRVQIDDLAALGTAVVRLRAELSRVVDAAFDALPAVEATASALHLDEPVRLPPPPAPEPRRSLLRRLLRV